jgi:hypothetical protein
VYELAERSTQGNPDDKETKGDINSIKRHPSGGETDMFPDFRFAYSFFFSHSHRPDSIRFLDKPFPDNHRHPHMFWNGPIPRYISKCMPMPTFENLIEKQ